MASIDDSELPSFVKPASISLAVLSLIVPIGTLSLGGFIQLGDWPSAMAPFGFMRIVIGYVLLCSPAVWWIAVWLAGWCRPIWEATTLFACLAGFVVAGCTLAVSSGAGIELSNDWLQRHAIRIVWVAALQFPFAFGSSVLAQFRNATVKRVRALDFAIAIGLVSVVPVLLCDFVILRQLSVLESANRNFQLRTALGVVERLNRFGCSVPELAADNESISIQAIEFRKVRNGLVGQEMVIRNKIADATDRIQNAAPKTDAQIIGLALNHYSLGRFSRASELLVESNLAASDAWGALVMGYIFEQQRKPTEAAVQYERAIELESSADSPRPNRLSGAYERLANMLRASRQATAAESVLQDGLKRHPEIADRLTFQLGVHYSQAGRTQEAMDAFESIANRDDGIGAQATSKIEALKTSFGICFVRTKK